MVAASVILEFAKACSFPLQPSLEEFPPEGTSDAGSFDELWK